MANSFDNINSIKYKLIDENYARDLLIRIRREYSDIENYLHNSNASWEEYFYDTEIVSNDHKIYDYKDDDDPNLEYNFKKIYKPNMSVKIDSNLKKYYPLRTFYFDNKRAICNVYGIYLDNIVTNKSLRDIYVRNDGLFIINKFGRNISYRLKYSVIDETYDFKIKRNNDEAFIGISNNENFLVKKYNNVTIYHDDNSKYKYIELKDHNNKLNVETKYTLVYDKNNDLKIIDVDMSKLKGNGRVESTFNLSIGDYSSYKVYKRNGEDKKTNIFSNRHMFLSLLDNDYKTTLYEHDDKPETHLKLFLLEEINRYMREQEYNSSNIDNFVMNISNEVDKSIANLYGEIPFASLNDKLREDISLSKIKENKGKSLTR